MRDPGFGFLSRFAVLPVAFRLQLSVLRRGSFVGGVSTHQATMTLSDQVRKCRYPWKRSVAELSSPGQHASVRIGWNLHTIEMFIRFLLPFDVEKGQGRIRELETRSKQHILHLIVTGVRNRASQTKS